MPFFSHQRPNAIFRLLRKPLLVPSIIILHQSLFQDLIFSC